MMTAESQHLLAEYVASGSERAFQELVVRYVDFVYSAALRLVERDSHRAQDVAQIVFVDLARMAPKLAPNTMLGGWLHRHTCFVARTLMRGERRRQARERQAVEMSALESRPDAALDEVAAVLDEAIHALGPDDRDAILLRFFEHRNLRVVGEALGINENVAQKRVARAVQELALLLRKRGFTVSAVALGAGLTAGAVQAAPATLAWSLTKAALAGVGSAGTSAGSAAQLAFTTKLKAALIGAILVAGLGTMVWLQFPSRARQPAGQQLASAAPTSSAGPEQADPATAPTAETPTPPAAPADSLGAQPTPQPPAETPLAPPPVAQPSPPPAITPQTAVSPNLVPHHFTGRAGSRVTIEGTANMFHTRWQVQGGIIQGQLDVGPGFPTEPGQAAQPGPVAASADVFIPVTSLKSLDAEGVHFSDAMDNTMYAQLKPEKQKKIYFHLTDLLLQQTATANNSPYLFESKGELAVAGVTNLITMPVQVLPLGGNKLRMRGQTTVKMSDYQISPPVTLGGALQTGDEVKLSFDWLVGEHASREGLVPLLLNLPTPGYKAGPESIHYASFGVEPLSPTPRPPLLVPPGLTNLARGARVTSSDKHLPPEALARIIDGDKEAKGQSIVFLRKGAQWVQLDLGHRCEIFAIALWHAHDAPKVYHDVVVQLADDPDCQNDPRTLFNNDRTNALGCGAGANHEYLETYEGKLIETEGAAGRYLRFYSRGSTQSALNEYTEIEVYGRRVP